MLSNISEPVETSRASAWQSHSNGSLKILETFELSPGLAAEPFGIIAGEGARAPSINRALLKHQHHFSKALVRFNSFMRGAHLVD